MDAPDGQVPAPRRAVPPRARRSAPTALPFAVPASSEDAPRVAGLSALLGDIDALRLTLQTDLSLAAAALEEGAQDLAAELVDGDLFEVRAFADRAAARLALLDGQAGAVEDELPAVVPVRRRRVLSAAPLMAAAAALIGFVALSPSNRPAQSPETTLTSAAMAGYELNRLASEGAPDEELRLAAMELNDELAQLIAQAKDDPAAAQQALMLLDQTSEVLASQGDSGVLRGVIRETAALRARLRDALPAGVRPSRPAGRPVLPVVVPRAEQEPERERASSSPAPKASPKPAASPKPTPSPAASTAPEPPADEPAPQTSEEPKGPLDSGLPGF